MDPLPGRKLCRLCLCSTAALINVLEENCGGHSVKETIEDILQEGVKEEHGLLWMICPTCLGKLNFFRFFRLQCIESNVTYKSRFCFVEKAGDYDGFSCNRYDRVEEVNQAVDPFPSSLCKRERICDDVAEKDVFTDLALEEAFEVTVISNEVTNSKDYHETDGKVPEFRTVFGWTEKAGGDRSYNHEENIGVEEVDTSEIKLESHEVGPIVWSEECLWTNQSEGGNEIPEESDKNHADDGGSVQSNGESPVEGSLLNSIKHRPTAITEEGKCGRKALGDSCKKSKRGSLTLEKRVKIIEDFQRTKSSFCQLSRRYRTSKGMIWRVLKDEKKILGLWNENGSGSAGTRPERVESKGVEHPPEAAVGSLSGHAFGNNENCTQAGVGESIPGSTNSNDHSVNGNECSPAMESSMSNCFNERQNLGDVVERGASSDGSSENRLGKTTGKFHKTKEIIGSASSVLQKVEPSLEPLISPMTKQINRKLSCGNLSSAEGNVKSFFTCDICGKWFHDEERLTSHIKCHDSGNLFKCQVCGLEFGEELLLSEHACDIKTEPSESLVMCGPGNLADSSSNLPTGVSDKPFECAICGQSFFRCDALERHVLSHMGGKDFACTHCSKPFKCKKSLLAHLSKEHGESNAMEKRCEVCGEKFHEKYFGMHLRTHAEEEMFKCSECGKDNMVRSDFELHLKQHYLSNLQTDHRYKCNYCQKSFTQNCILKIHTRVHTGEKPFSCPTCGRPFSQKGSLTKHLLTHQGPA